MKLVWTRGWAIKPTRYRYFRVSTQWYLCHFILWHWALIEEVEV